MPIIRYDSSPNRPPAGSSLTCIVRNDLWAKVTRTLFFDLVDLGEERELGGKQMFGVSFGGRFFAMAPADEPQGACLMEPGVPIDEVAAPGREFFERARARLNREVPTALTDLSVAGVRGDLDLDPVMWEKAGVKATKPAAVLIPVVERPEPGVLLTQRTPAPAEPFRADRVSRRQDRSDRRKPAGRGIARGQGGDRPRCERFVEPIGYLDLYLTFSGFRILPLLARVDPPTADDQSGGG